MTIRVYRSADGKRIGVIAPTWELNPRITKESLAGEFEKNEARAWRDYGAEPSFSVEGFFKDREAVVRMANREREDPWDHAEECWKPWFTGGPHEYYCHFDLSETRAATGFAMAHYDAGTDRVVVDAMLVFRPGVGRSIDFAGLRRLVYDLGDRGFYVACVSYDRFQSAESRQVLTAKGYRVALISTDASYNVELTRPVLDRTAGRMISHVTPKPLEIYDTYQECLLSGRLDYWPHPTLIAETQGLELHAGSRVCAAAGGSKDLADAVAIVTWQCIVNRPGTVRLQTEPGRGMGGGEFKALSRAFKYRRRS
jgi:hypothetical protein